MNCHFKRKNQEPIGLREVNQLLSSIRSRVLTVKFCEYIEGQKNTAFIEDGMRFLRITCHWNGKMATFVFDKAKDDRHEAKRQCSSGMDAFMLLRKTLGKTKNALLPRIVKEEDLELGKNIYPFSASPLLYCNPKYNGTEQEAWGYDMNSAYAYAMLGEMPDTRGYEDIHAPSYNPGIVEKGQIGFDSVGELVPGGSWATFRFPAMESPFKDFANKYYKIKSNPTTTPQEKEKAKDVLNHSVGYFQRINPFIRAAIVSRANSIIMSLMDEDTLYCNTDSIVSKRKRDDLKLGNGLGEWKLEHQGTFRYRDMNYQWNNEPPAYRGIPKSWFKKGFNILTDELPFAANQYQFDPIKLKVVKA